MKELNEIKSGFTAEERAEFNRRNRVVLVLLSRIAAICAELGELIEERGRDIKSGKILINAMYVTGAVMGLLIWLELISYKLLLIPGFSIGWLILRNEISPDGLNGPRILGLRQIVTPMIVRIEELGVSEAEVFLWVRHVSKLKDETISKIRSLYLSGDLDSDSDISDDEDEDYDWELVRNEGGTYILSRIRTQLAESVTTHSNR